MKKLFIIIVSLLCSGVLSVSAQNNHKDITLEKAGTLIEKLSREEISLIESIKISGKINADDISLLSKMSRGENKLKEIDLSNAEIVMSVQVSDPVLEDKSEYFLPNIDIIGKGWAEGKGDEYEKSQGHTKSPMSVTGFWVYETGKKLFPLVGYMNGWDAKINEAVLKSKNVDYIRSRQVKKWIEDMGYVFRYSRSDGDDVFKHKDKELWLLLHYKPYNKSDFPGIHFSIEKYEKY